MFFFGKKDPDRLLRKATEYGNAKDWDSAIICLRDAFSRMDKEEIEIKTSLRLPMYLQKAGKNNEAWGEFNRLIVEKMQTGQFVDMKLHIIWDKMRLFLQREGKYEYAIAFAVVAYLAWMKGLHVQERSEEFLLDSEDAVLEKRVIRHLKKAKRMDVKEGILQLVHATLESIDTADLGSVQQDIQKRLMKNDKS